MNNTKTAAVFGEAKNPVAEPLVVCLSDSVVCCIILCNNFSLWLM